MQIVTIDVPDGKGPIQVAAPDLVSVYRLLDCFRDTKKDKGLIEELLGILDMFVTKYGEGVACYEDPEACKGYLGRTILPDAEAFDQALDILDTHRSRSKQ